MEENRENETSPSKKPEFISSSRVAGELGISRALFLACCLVYEIPLKISSRSTLEHSLSRVDKSSHIFVGREEMERLKELIAPQLERLKEEERLAPEELEKLTPEQQEFLAMFGFSKE